jgi:hypothetical protein
VWSFNGDDAESVTQAPRRYPSWEGNEIRGCEFATRMVFGGHYDLPRVYTQHRPKRRRGWQAAEEKQPC